MENQMIFKRYEMKYLINDGQRTAILAAMQPYMRLDTFGHSVIRNIYFDTDNYRLVRHSIEKPVYKEKLRMRSYQKAGKNDPVFLELKKKYQGIVYKRRILLPQQEAFQMIQHPSEAKAQSQIEKEIAYFCMYYFPLKPVVYLSYEREAYYSLDGSDFRVTFDEAILSRSDRLFLDEDPGGNPLVEESRSIMEIKTPAGLPMWMVHCLSSLHLYKTSYSKYGTAYQQMIMN